MYADTFNDLNIANDTNSCLTPNPSWPSYRTVRTVTARKCNGYFARPANAQAIL